MKTFDTILFGTFSMIAYAIVGAFALPMMVILFALFLFLIGGVLCLTIIGIFFGLIFIGLGTALITLTINYLGWIALTGAVFGVIGWAGKQSGAFNTHSVIAIA